MSNRHNAAAGASIVAARQPIDGLLVWGRIVKGKPVLEPAFRVTAPATPLTARATHRLQALDGNGALLAEFPVQPQQLDHHDAATFAVVVPWSAQLERELATLRVRDVRVPLATAQVTSRAAQLAARQQLPIAAPVDPAAAVRAVGARRLRMEWNSNEYPVALVREAGSGRIVALLREHAREFISSGQADFSVTFSDGVRSVTRRLGQ